MKKLLFLLLLFVMTSAWSQTRPLSRISPLQSRDMIYQWDTIVAYDTTGLSQRWLQELDNFGNIITKTMQLRVGQDWVNDTRYAYTYTAYRQLLTITTLTWNSGNWENVSFDTYIYNSQNNPVEEIFQMWNNGAWVNDTRWTWEYDNNGDNTLLKTETWGSGWENYYQNVMTYDQFHNMITNVSQNWVSSAWENATNMTYTFDNAHHMLSEQQQHWVSNAWENVYLINYTWDGNGYKTSYLMKFWQNGGWVDQWLHTLNYDTYGYLTEEIWQLWDNGAWVNFYRNAFTYNAHHDQLTDLWQNWVNGAWENYHMYTYGYDLNGNSLTGKYEEWINGSWQPGMWNIWVFCQQVKTDLIVNNYQYFAHFTSFTSGVSDHRRNELKVYPNPATTTVTIDLPQNEIGKLITITDMNGKEVLNTRANGSKAIIDVRSLSDGVYFVEVNGSKATLVIR